MLSHFKSVKYFPDASIDLYLTCHGPSSLLWTRRNFAHKYTPRLPSMCLSKLGSHSQYLRWAHPCPINPEKPGRYLKEHLLEVRSRRATKKITVSSLRFISDSVEEERKRYVMKEVRASLGVQCDFVSVMSAASTVGNSGFCLSGEGLNHRGSERSETECPRNLNK